MPNDNFADRIILSGNNVTTTGSNVGFTSEIGEPAQGVFGEVHSAWWSWTAPSSGTVTIDTNGSNYDTFLSVFTGSAVDDLTTIGQNDDFGSLQSQITFTATAGTTYQIAVDGFSTGQGNIQLNITAPNVPAIIIGDIEGTVIEDAVTSTATGSLTATDVDSSNGFIAQTGVVSIYGTFSIDVLGNWTYILDNDDADTNALAAGAIVTDIITVQTDDGTPQDITITITGTDDAPVINSSVIELDETDEILTTSGALITDVDSDLEGTFVAQVDVAGNNGTFSVDSEGNYTYTANEAFDDLNVGQFAVDTFTVEATDGSETTVEITINGTNDAAVLSSAVIELDETNEILSTEGSLTITDVDNENTAFVAQTIEGGFGTFSIDAEGNYTFTAAEAFDSLNDEDVLTDTFTVEATDGTGSTVQVTLNGTNDAAELSSAVIVLDETNEILSTEGSLTITDVDNEDTAFVAQMVEGEFGTFSIDAEGSYTFTAAEAFDSLNDEEVLTETFTVDATDGTETTVEINLIGTNDVAEISSAVIELDETDEALTTAGNLTISDVDNEEAFIAQTVEGDFGTFSIDAAGAFTFTANEAFDSLNVDDSRTETFRVEAIDGTESTVQVTLNGTNDAAELSSEVIELDEADEALTTAGSLTISDVDNEDAFVAQTIVGNNGTFSIDAAGAFTFTANSSFNNLNVGQFAQETFTVEAVDGTETTVQVTINGINDAAVLSSEVIELDETDEVLTTAGSLTITDVDSNEAFVAQMVEGDFGTFSIDAEGNYTFTAAEAFDSLNDEDVLTETFTVAAVDGTESTVEITLNGTNDVAELSSEVIELDETDEALTTTGSLTISDVDNEEAFVAQTVEGEFGTFSINAEGAFTFTAAEAFDSLNVDDSLNEIFTVEAADGTETTVEITLNGTNDVAVLGSAVIAIDEADEILTTEGSLTITDVDNEDTTFVAQTVEGEFGTFSLDAEGNYTFTANEVFDSLNVEDVLPETFTVAATDGTESTVAITLNGTNDAAELSSAVIELDETDEVLTTAGTLTISDVDNDAAFVAQIVEGDFGSFSIDASGAFTFTANEAFDSLNEEASLTETFIVAAVDGTETTVEITLNGTNDAAVLSSAVIELDEADETLTTVGSLTIADVDNEEAFVAQTFEGDFGTFSIDPSGVYTFTAAEAFDSLNIDDSLNEIFTVEAADGTEGTVEITLNGTNDAAVLSSAVIELDEADEILTTEGSLTITDVDNEDTAFVAETLEGEFGTFSLDAEGNYTFTANEAFDNLNVEDVLTETFTVAATDGTQSTVAITLNGTNDAAELSSAVIELDETDEALTTAGNLTISDVDNEEAFVAQDIEGEFGTLSINAEGAFTFTAREAFDSINVGDSLNEIFTVAAADGTETTVEITLNGTDDAAVLSSAVIELDETNEILSAEGSLTITDVDNEDTAFVAQTVEGEFGTFVINAEGAFTFTAREAFDSLNVEDFLTETFTVAATDGTETTVEITLNGTNDAAVLSSEVIELDETDEALTTAGNLTITDADNEDVAFVAQTIEGEFGSFVIDAAGAFTFTAAEAYDSLNVGQSVNETFTVETTDEDEATVELTINGTNDAPVAEVATNTATEDEALVTGTVTSTDVDNGATATYALIGDVPAGLTLDTEGNYSFDPSNEAYQFLANGETTDIVATFEVTDDQGDTDTNTLTITVTGVTDTVQNGTLGPDQISGTPFADTLSGFDGDDTISGANNNDILNGGNGDDTLLGQGGDDTLVGASGNDRGFGGNGNDVLSGGIGDDTLLGQGGEDTLVGASGADSLVGASGNDLLQGGLNNDILIGGGLNDTLEGQEGDDTLIGASGFDSLLGAAGNDLLLGGLANDTLYGGSGNDTLQGQGGRDVLLGGSGNDSLVGGDGADLFGFDSGFNSLGVDTISDFSGDDILQLSQSTFGLSGIIGGTISTSDFASVDSLIEAESSGAAIAYNSNDGSLYFNANSAAAGFGNGGQFAQLNNTFDLQADQIELIA